MWASRKRLSLKTTAATATRSTLGRAREDNPTCSLTVHLVHARMKRRRAVAIKFQGQEKRFEGGNWSIVPNLTVLPLGAIWSSRGTATNECGREAFIPPLHRQNHTSRRQGGAQGGEKAACNSVRQRVPASTRHSWEKEEDTRCVEGFPTRQRPF